MDSGLTESSEGVGHLSIRLNPVSQTVGLTAGLTLQDMQTDMHFHMMSPDGASHIVRVTGHNETLFFHF